MREDDFSSSDSPLLDPHLFGVWTEESTEGGCCMSLMAHLVELRKRLVVSLLVLVSTFFLCYTVSDSILVILTRPLTPLMKGRPFIYTGLTEAFMTYMKASFVGALLLSFPVWIWQIWAFVGPGLRENERRACRPFLWGAPILFLCGCALAYFVVCPCAWSFFMSFEQAAVPLRLEARISEYVGLTVQLLTVFGLAFQLPTVLAILCSLGVCQLETLKKQRKYAFLIITIIAAIITPPDFLSPIGLIIPVYGLYEGTILWIRFMHKNGSIKEQSF